MENLELLHHTMLFKGSTDEELELALSLFQERQIKSHTTIFTEHAPAEALYIIKSGIVRVSILAGDGRDQGLLLLTPGEFFGELALIQGDGRLTTAKSEGLTELLMLTRKDFQALLDLDPRTSSRLLMTISNLLAMRIRAYGDRFRNLLTA